MKGRIFWRCSVVLALMLLWPALAAAKAKAPVLAAGEYHSLTIRADGTLWAWGRNNLGQLGLGADTSNRMAPVRVGPASDWVAVAAGGSHSLGIRADGSLWAWGYNGYGQLGLAEGDTSNRNHPTPVGTDRDWVAVAAGANHSLAIRANGSLYAWGQNNIGQLGLQDSLDRQVPSQVSFLVQWVAVAAGANHSLAIKANGSLYAWGANGYGQLGLGSFPSLTAPQQVGSDTDWVAVVAGQNHSLGLKAGGSLYAWGDNVLGQLGLGGSIETQTTPWQVGSDSN